MLLILREIDLLWGIFSFVFTVTEAIIFPGQGCQVVGMAKEFYDNFAIAKRIFEEANDILGKNLTKIIFDGPFEELTLSDNTQPAIMVTSIAILETLKSEIGKDIDSICKFTAGHSLGEYTALCASHSFSFSDAVRLLRVRGEAFLKAGEMSSGAMAVISAPIAEIDKIIAESRLDGELLEITNDNTYDQVVISGNARSVDRALDVARDRGISRLKKLSVSGAFHSKLMEPAVDDMHRALENCRVSTPAVSVVANYTAKIETVEEIRSNLLEQITHRVRWRETMLNLEQYGVNIFIEIGPGRVLTNMVKKTCPNAKAIAISSLEQMKEFIETLN
ncbi:MAG: ACP S-malonyltransferase [Rickettsiales bacterium]|jgi:[acyl-carrier-protein] S-malonyltransferase|nr:ACP S-malonyltransferase [Rickettsiales bacterium]